MQNPNMQNLNNNVLTDKYHKYKTKYQMLKKQMGGNTGLIGGHDKIDPDAIPTTNTNTNTNTNQIISARKNCPMDEEAKKNYELSRKMNYEGFNKRNWKLVSDLFDENLSVTFIDGTKVVGREANLKIMQSGLGFAPDTMTTEMKPIFGCCDWLALTLKVEGTFSQPMITPDGKTIAPTGRKFVQENYAISRWKDGKEVEGYAFFDINKIMQQLGIKP